MGIKLTNKRDITVWGRRCSFNVQKVLWTLDELGLSYRHIDAGGAFGGLDEPAFRTMNPHGTVPVLKDGEHAIWESNTILRYLAARYGVGTLWDEDPARRSLTDHWIDWSASGLQPSFLRLFWGYYRTPAEQRNEGLIGTHRKECSKHFRALDARLAQQAYLAGQQFSLADIAAGTCLHRYFNMGLAVDRPAHVLAWWARLQQREAFGKNVARPFDALFGRLAY
jgi:glutathione S-transferase